MQWCRCRHLWPLIQVLPTLCELIKFDDEEILANVCWAVSYFSDAIQAVIDSGIVPDIVALLKHPELPVHTAALNAVGNLASGNSFQTDVILKLNALPGIQELLRSAATEVRQDACWTVSNITAGERSQIQCVIDSGILDEIVRMFNKDVKDVRMEAVSALANLTDGGSPEQIRYLAEMDGCLPGIVRFLAAKDQRVANACLSALKNILQDDQDEQYKEALLNHLLLNLNLEDRLEALTESPHDEIASLAQELLDYVNS
eukprot:m.189906 g.189906  ORF g.189906 m.189906 type:complete len:259 (-) comp10040_c0_seq13:2537-3313(-)